MQKFSKKQIALAVSASLLAGSALAAPTAPVARATKPVLIAGLTSTQAADLYKTTGFAGNVSFNVYFTAAAETDTPANFQQIDAGTALLVNTGTVAAPAEDDIQVYVDNAAKDLFTVTGSSFTPNGATAQAFASVTISKVGTDAAPAFRINAGKLEYTANSAATTPVWTAVKVVINKAATAANAIRAVDTVATVATPTALAASVAAQDVYTSVVPDLKSNKTRATNGLVDGITFETYTPLSAFANDDVDVGTVSKTAGSITTKTAALTAGWTAQAKAGATNTYEVFFATPATIDWTAGDTTADAAAYSSDLFNTGVAGAALPFSVVPATATPANQTDYSEVFDAATGNKAKFSTGLAASASTDGAAPVLKTAVYNLDGSLTLTLSEKLAYIGAGKDIQDIRKVLENVTLAGTKLAADFQLRNAVADITVGTSGNVNELGTLNIAGLGTGRTDVENKTVAVLPTIALKDAYSNQDVATLDSAGIKSFTGVDEGASGSVPATAVNTVAWADSTARAYYSTVAAEAGQIKTIVVDFGKALSLKTGGSLDKTFKIEFGVKNALEEGGAVDGYTFNWFPAAGEYAIKGNTIEFTLPTALLRSNLREVNDAVVATTVTYTGTTATVASPLQAAVGATKVDVGNGFEKVIMPLSPTTTGQSLYTMDVKADLKAPAGSKVIAYLAKWVDGATAAAASTKVVSGKISIPGDKWATDVALSLDDSSFSLSSNDSVDELTSAIDTQLKAAKPAAVPAWIVVNRSNDLAKGGNNSGNGTENYLVASASLFGTLYDATQYANSNQSSVFEVAVDPKTGNISGRLTGNLKLKNTTTTNANNRGLVFIKPDGSLTDVATSAATNQALVGADGKARFLIGAGPKKDLKDAGAVFKDAFVLLVGVTQDASGNESFKLLTSAEPSMSNFLPFSSNLIAGNDALGTVTLDVANIKTSSLATTGSWQLVSGGNLDRSAKAAAAINLPRLLVGLNASNVPTSFWTNDSGATDMALTLLGNKSGVAVEAADKDVNTVADKANTKANAFAFAFANDAVTGGNLFFLTKTAQAPALPVGWALVAANAATLPSDVSMVLRAGSSNVGIGSSWATGDGTLSLTAGEPVFVYAKKAISGN